MISLSLASGADGAANAPSASGLQSPLYSQTSEDEGLLHESYTIGDMRQIDPRSVEELFTNYIDLDSRDFMHLNKEAVLNSPHRDNLGKLPHFTGVVNEINAHNLGIESRDGWSFAKCVIVDAVGINMVSWITRGLYTAIRAARWPLAAKTILQISDPAGIQLGWKANAACLAIALGKSAIYCRSKL